MTKIGPRKCQSRRHRLVITHAKTHTCTNTHSQAQAQTHTLAVSWRPLPSPQVNRSTRTSWTRPSGVHVSPSPPLTPGLALRPLLLGGAVALKGQPPPTPHNANPPLIHTLAGTLFINRQSMPTGVRSTRLMQIRHWWKRRGVYMLQHLNW